MPTVPMPGWLNYMYNVSHNYAIRALFAWNLSYNCGMPGLLIIIEKQILRF